MFVRPGCSTSCTIPDISIAAISMSDKSQAEITSQEYKKKVIV
jgi:hypothetical protein